VQTLALASRLYGGLQAFADLTTLDNSSYPKRGFFGQLSATVRTDLTPDADNHFGTSGLFTAAAGTYIPFDRSQRFVLGTRVKAHYVVGDFPFYFAPTLGDNDLRAYNDEQLAGDGVFSQTTDLRVELLRFREGLPSAIGIAGSIDHGLAFGPLVESNNYNVIVGGSIFWSILDLVGFNLGYYAGLDEATRLTLSFGPVFADTGFIP